MGYTKAYSRTLHRKSRANRPICYSRKVERALLQSIGKMRDYEIELFEVAPDSMLGLRVASIRTEMTRLKVGLPVRLDGIIRAVAGVAQ